MSDRREGAGGGVVLLVIVVLALLVGGGWAAAYYRAGDTLAHGTSVDGIDVGGRTPAQAVALLRPAMQHRLTHPISVTTGQRTVPVRPVDAGLGIDLGATVDQGETGRSWRPGSLWQHYSGGQQLSPVLTVDGRLMAAQVAELQRRLGTTARDGAIAFRGARAVVRQPRTGHQLDPAETANALEAAFRSESDEALLTLHDVDPRVDDADVRRAMDHLVNPALSGSVRLLFGDVPARLQPRDFTAALSLRARDGRLVARVDRLWLARLVGGIASYSQPPVDATVALVEGRPHVVPAQPGVTYDQAGVARAFLAAVGRDLGKRSVQVRGTTARPRVSSDDARRWQIRDVVATDSTRAPHGDLAPVVDALDQTVLAPGRSLHLGPALGGLASTRGVDRLARAVSTAAARAGLAVDGEGGSLVVHNRSRYGVLLHLGLRGSGPDRTLRVQLWSRG